MNHESKTLQDLFEHKREANRKTIEALGKLPEEGMPFELMSHILNAHAVWNARIEGIEAPYGIWEIHEQGRMAPIDEANHRNTSMLLQKHSLDQEVQYTNSKGRTFSNTLREILHHLIIHGAHHRAQVLMKLREKGVQPPITDYIMYKREEQEV